jgi:gamma-glutamyltranspeptidase / glutathione hydrolase
MTNLKMILYRIWPAFILPAVLLGCPGEAPPRPSNFKSGVVASAHPLASKVGAEILEGGGNAVDAAVGTSFALGVVEPQASGIGGGGFMLIYTAHNKKVVTIDYRESAPRRATADLYQRSPDQLRTGYRAVAVPGTVAGLALALEKYGTMDLETVLQPAIQLAEQGFPVSSLLSDLMANNASKLSQSPAAAKIYLKNQRPYQAGDQLYQQDLADTYRLIAESGPDVFYKGTIAEAIEREMKSLGAGLITREDLAAYRPILRTPVKGEYRDYDIYSVGPPSSGAQVIGLLKIFSRSNVAESGLNSAQAIEIMAQAMVQVFAERAKYMGDPDFVEIPLEKLLSEEPLQELGQIIKITRLGDEPVASESHNTTHLSVADKQGNLVSLSQSINYFFGSGVVVPGTGILLNNTMGDFNLQPGSPNAVEPGKRPLSSMSPTVVLKNGNPVLSIGTPGATRIISSLPQILINIFDHGLFLEEAIRAPRMHCMTGVIYLEARIPQQVRSTLIRQGYRIHLKKNFDLYFGGAQGVAIDPKTGMLSGAADPRREGAISGY